MAIYVIVKRTDFRLCMLATAILIPVAVIFLILNFHKFSNQPNSSFTSTSDQTGSRALSSLQFIIVVSRHGNRPQLVSFPTWIYPVNNTKFWPLGASQLTPEGRVKMYRLGTKIRTLYNGYLSQLYYPGHFKVYSTLTDRSLQSAEAYLAGLFPPNSFQVWNQDLKWQPLPIYPTYLDRTSQVQGLRSVCPRFYEEKKMASAQFARDYTANFTSLLNYVQPYTGLTVIPGSHSGLYSVWDSLASAENEGLPLPSWTTSIYPEPLASLISKFYTAIAIGSDNMIRLFEGSLFQEMVHLIEAKVTGMMVPDRRMVHYSGHDLTILGLQAILGMPQATEKIVNTGSALILELHKNLETNIYYVQVLYIDGKSTDLEPSVLDIPGCNSPCSFEILKSLTEKYYNITNFTQECQIS